MLSVTDEDFDRLVAEGIEMIPSRHHSKIKNIAVVVEHEPTADQLYAVEDKQGGTLLGLYEGIPLTQRGEYYMFTVPDKITIFKDPILQKATNLEEVREIVKNTVWHEFAHYFGFDEDEVEEREILEGRDKF